jgi:hypothetical protein
MQYIGHWKIDPSAARGGLCGRKVAEIIKWPVVLLSPGEEELTLLADLSARRDARILAVIDPDGFSVGASLAEVMGLRVIKDLSELEPGAATYLVHPPLDDKVAPIVDQAKDYALKAVSASEFPQFMAGPNLTDPRFSSDPDEVNARVRCRAARISARRAAASLEPWRS